MTDFPSTFLLFGIGGVESQAAFWIAVVRLSATMQCRVRFLGACWFASRNFLLVFIVVRVGMAGSIGGKLSRSGQM